MLANDNHDRPSLAINDQTDLPGNVLAEQGQLPRLFQQVPSPGRKPPVVQPGQPFDLTGLEPGQISLEFGGYRSSLPR
ncbi:hypothetical protein DPF_1519 [Desulfoplanes formicivorans]|uniref:Uncharacterized protein n=1 Tax=Desulfoplanes formicivorans TaxID=1592317 RepID=A0A194AFF5_9BACT|nr:hypothetical protein DPF_1519 [Desulfoplanes formicivorans]